MRPLEHALKFMASAKVYVFPLKPGEKTPLLDGSWKEQSTNDPGKVKFWLVRHPMANYAVDCEKSGLCVIDVDNKKGKDGNKSWTQLLESRTLEAREVLTPSGGRHLYFRGKAASRTGLLEGLDVRSTGGYVVGPGSALGGIAYVDKGNSSIDPLPDWLQTTIGQTMERESVRAPSSIVTQPEDLAAARNVARELPLAVEGDAGDITTYRAACKMKDMGLSMEDAFTVLSEDWNPYCEPPWTTDELQRKVENAYRYGKSIPGLCAVSAFDDENDPDDRAFHVSELISKEPPKREWVIDQWLPKGAAVLLAGEGGVGKSQLLVQMALSVATGLPFVGLAVEEPMQVLLVACEDDKAELSRRAYYLARAPEFALSDLQNAGVHVWPRVGKESYLMTTGRDGRTPKFGGFHEMLIKYVTRHMKPGPKLLVLDTVPDMFAGNENDRMLVNWFSKVALGNLLRDHQCTIICNSHPSKMEGAEYSGSTAWNGAFRARWFFRPHEDPEFRVLELRKSNYSISGTSIMLSRGVEGMYRVVSPGDATAKAAKIMLKALMQAKLIGKWIGLNCIKGHSLMDLRADDEHGVPLTDNLRKAAVEVLLREGVLIESRVPGIKSCELIVNDKLEFLQ
jgi:hypothetical protein